MINGHLAQNDGISLYLRAMLYALPFISAFIGWITNFFAIKMLFHPRVEKNILGLKIQGIFPKRQKQFAEKLGNLVSDELLSLNDIQDKINSPTTRAQILIVLDEKMEYFLQHKLGKAIPMLSMFIGGETKTKIKNTLLAEFEENLPDILNKLNENIQQDLDIKKLVVEKVSNFSVQKLEDILYDIMKREFRFIEILGAVLGFLIGLFQLGLIMLSGEI